MTDWRQCSLAHMPSEVIFMIAEYLTPREKSTLSQVNKHFRDLLNNGCPIWKNVTLVISPKRLDQCKDIVRLVKQRNITSLSFATAGSPQIQKAILKELPDLEALSIPLVRLGTLSIVRAFCKKLKKLYIWRLMHNYRLAAASNGIEKTVRKLNALEELSLKGTDLTISAFPNYRNNISNIIPYLKKLELHFHTLETAWFLGVLCLLLNLKSFVADVSHYNGEGGDFPSTFPISQSFAIEEITFQHALPKLLLSEESIHLFQRCHELTTLDLRHCKKIDLKPVLENLHRLPSLTKLNLVNCAINNDMLPSLPDLPHLDLEGSWNLTQQGIRSLALKCPWLTYLGLANCSRLKENSFKILPTLFPRLDTLDVSGNRAFTDEVLKEFYLRSQNTTPSPRKMIAKKCLSITKGVIILATEKFRHQLVIIT